MGRSDNKKSRARPPATDNTVPVAPTARPPMPGADQPAQVPRGDASNPRVTTDPRVTPDNPWRDLHPSRIWPD